MPWVDTPFGTQVKTSKRNHNQNVIRALPQNALFQIARIGLIADSHQNHAALVETLKLLNASNLDLIIHLGDFTDHGYAPEFDAFVTAMTTSQRPYIVTLGNHDALGLGRRLHAKIFGEYNVAFHFNGRRFIIFNSNSIEFRDDGGIDYEWLERELKDATDPTYLFQHVNQESPDYFTVEEQSRFAEIFEASPSLRLVVNGHVHNFEKRDVVGVPVRSIARVERVRYAILELNDAQDTLLFCHGSDCESEVLTRR